MANQTTEFKRTVSGTINSGMRSVFGGEGRRYFIIEHKDDSALHRRGEQQKMIVDEVFIGRDLAHSKSMSEAVMGEIDKEVKAIIDECYAETKRILIEKQAIVEGLAQRLMKKLTVDGPDFEKIYVNNGDLSKVFPDVAIHVTEKTETEEPAAEVKEPEAQALEETPAEKPEDSAPTWPAEAANRDFNSDPGPTD